jgi:putative ABC transport system ATP-binding protein
LTSSLLELRGLSKIYEQGSTEVRALNDVNLRIEAGEFLSIMGPSGSGKSTLLNILGCLDLPTSGSYLFNGTDLSKLGERSRALFRRHYLGFVFQSFNLLPRTTAAENVEMPLVYHGVSAAERRRRAMLALGAVGLGSRAHHTPAELSGGQQQRVAIARAIVTDPPILLADEPTGNLDTKNTQEVMTLLSRLNEERRLTIILITHEPEVAEHTRRTIVVRDGRIASDSAAGAP